MPGTPTVLGASTRKVCKLGILGASTRKVCKLPVGIVAKYMAAFLSLFEVQQERERVSGSIRVTVFRYGARAWAVRQVSE
jgi:hypothetical protein